jgi:hypothetical protein
MMMPLVVTTIARPVGSITPVLAVVTVITASVALWLRHAVGHLSVTSR